ncbi:MAG TPA: tetratricopeptide repeat protein [Acidobacteriaceae bacterium]
MSPRHRSVLPNFFRSFVAALALIVAGTSVCAQTPASTTSSLREARRLLSEHQAARAEAIVRPLLTRDPQNSTALRVLAQARLDQGDSNEAMTLLLRALAASPNSREVNNALGDLLLKQHHAPEAMDRFETVLAQTPADPGARRGELAAATELALTARNAQHPEIALEVLRHARTKLPDDPQLLLELGIQANELQLLPEAAEALTSAHKISPHDLDIIYALGRLELDQQHMAAAEADFRTYLAARPGDASAHFGLGHILAMDQRPDEARAEFERSIQLHPVQTESYYQIGQIELDAQHDAQAEPLFRKALERDPTHGGALTGMGILSFRAKDYAKAEQYLAAAEKTAPDYGPAHYYRGLSLARLGRKDEADAELRKATDLGKAALGTPVRQ